MKIIVGVALLAGEAALMFIPGLQVAGIWAFANTIGATAFGALTLGIASMAAGLIMGGIADMLSHTPGSAIAARNPIAPWQVIYGSQMVGGTLVDIGETGSNDKYLHLVCVTACHQTHGFQGLYLDGKLVVTSGDPLAGCTDDGGTHYDLSGMPYNFKGKVYLHAFLGAPGQAACTDYINRSNGHWTASHTLSGRSYIYVRLQFDSTVFPNGMPQVKSLWYGKTDILDPRTGTRGYSTNAALCINDFLTNQDYGFRCATTEINQAALTAAANLCDSYTTTGTVEPLYALNGVFNLASTPAEILNNMLSAMAGQISYNGGQFSIYGASWRGAVCVIDQTDLIAPIKYKPKRKIRELYNSVRGTFLSPSGLGTTRGPGVQTGQINPWEGMWQYTDIPDYAEDTLHGYASDVWNTADGQSLYLNTKFPFTTSVSTCQRLAKIMLERNRQQGSGTLQCGLSAYGIQPLDIIEFSYPRFGWLNKLFEVSGTRLTFKAEDGKPPVPIVELDITETDPRVYSWAGTEELSLAGQASPLLPSSFGVVAPTGLTLTDDASTAVALTTGSSMARLLVAWTAPMDPFVTTGGTIQIQYQLNAASNPQTAAWVDAGSVSGDANYTYIDNVASNATVSVQIRSVRASGSTSDWLVASRSATLVGIPANVTGLSATESPFKTDAGMQSLVSVSFTPPATNFGSALVYFTNYNGCTAAQLMATCTSSPATFLCDTTHETVEVTVLALSPNAIPANTTGVPAVYLALDGVQSSPPAPSVSAAQTALDNGSGWQFTFNVLSGLEYDLVSGYRIYHSENAADAAPAYYETKPQPPTNVGTITVQEVTGDLLWYWVSAISTSGLESIMTAVPFQYVDPGAAPPSLTPVATTQAYKPVTLLNGWAKSAHVGYWEPQNSDNGTTFGLSSSQIANAYTTPTNAYDGNQSTAAGFSQAHNAEYAGAVWTFNNNSLTTGATTTAATLSIVSDVLQTSGLSGEASVWYSTDAGSTWTMVYLWDAHSFNLAPRAKQTDTITLPTSITPANLQVMTCAHSHDDIAHNIYEVNLSVTQSAYAGPEKVTGVKAALVGGNVQISWNGLLPLTRTDLISYQVYRAAHGAGYTLSHLEATITPTGVATYTWTDTQAHDGSFDYWVIAQNHTGYGPASDVATLYSGASLLYSNGKTAEDLRPAAYGADVTASNTAYDVVHVNGVASSSISPISNLMPRQAGADVTASNTAAAISGQGSLATQSNVALATQVSGQLPYANHSSVLTGAVNSSGHVLNLYDPTGTTNLMPSQAGADKTAMNSASGVQGHVIFLRPNTYSTSNPFDMGAASLVNDSASGSSMGNVLTFNAGWASQTVVNASTGFAPISYDMYVRVRTNGAGTNPTTLPGGIYDATTATYPLGFTLSGLTTAYQEVYAGRFILTSATLNDNVRTYFSSAGVTTQYSLDYVRFVPTVNLDSNIADGLTFARTAKSGLNASGGLDFSQGVHTNRNTQYLTESGGAYFAAEHGANITSGHVLTSTVSPPNVQVITTTKAKVGSVGLNQWFGWSVNVSAAANDVYNVSAVIVLSAGSAASSPVISVMVDGVTTAGSWSFPVSASGQTVYPFVCSVSGLTAGAHAIQFYAVDPSGNNPAIYATSYAICQRVY